MCYRFDSMRTNLLIVIKLGKTSSNLSLSANILITILYNSSDIKRYKNLEEVVNYL